MNIVILFLFIWTSEVRQWQLYFMQPLNQVCRLVKPALQH